MFIGLLNVCTLVNFNRPSVSNYLLEKNLCNAYLVSVNVDYINVYVLQRKNRIITNVHLSLNNYMIWVLVKIVKMIARGILTRNIVNARKNVRLMNI